MLKYLQQPFVWNIMHPGDAHVFIMTKESEQNGNMLKCMDLWQRTGKGKENINTAYKEDVAQW